MFAKVNRKTKKFLIFFTEKLPAVKNNPEKRV